MGERRVCFEVSSFFAAFLVLLLHHSGLVTAQAPKSPWLTLSGSAPAVVAKGGFSGLFPESSQLAYDFTFSVSSQDAISWCDVQLTKDGVGICLPTMLLDNCTDIQTSHPNNEMKNYSVNGVSTSGLFSVDYDFSSLFPVSGDETFFQKYGVTREDLDNFNVDEDDQLGDDEFSDIFDLEHFKRVLADDVRVVSSLPSTHLMSRPVEEKRTPLHVSPRWIRSRYLRRLNKEGVLLLRGLDSRLSKDLPSDLQKLRCKVAFQALKFSAPIQELGNKLATRMRSKGPYLALHLRMEKDVWVRTGCLPGLSHVYDEIIHEERKLRPELLTARSNMSYYDRKLAGLCPLNAVEVTRLLKALEAPKNAMIYWAGGEPFGGLTTLQPLTKEFPNFYNKQNLSLSGELEPFRNKASSLAAIDYIVCEKSDVFMPSHGGNMGHVIQGHRAFKGHRKFTTPNKRQMLPYFLDDSLSESEFNRIVKELHQGSIGEPEIRKAGRDVTAYPVPECMCNSTDHTRSVI